MATKEQIKAKILELINDNSAGDITAKDVRDSFDQVLELDQEEAGASAFKDLTGKIANSQIPEFAITDDKLAKQKAHEVMKYDAAGVANAGLITNANIGDDQIDEDSLTTAIRAKLDKADKSLSEVDIKIVDSLPDPISDDEDVVLILRDPVEDTDAGVYVVKQSTGDYYEGLVGPSVDSVIGLQANLDRNPDGSVSEIEWTINGVHIYLEFKSDIFTGEPPDNLYLQATDKNDAGNAIVSGDALSAADLENSKVTLARVPVYDRLGNYSYGQLLTHDTLVFWGSVDDGQRLRFKVYTDSAFSTPLISAGGKYYDLITDNKFPRQTALERLAQGDATDGEVLAWKAADNEWKPSNYLGGTIANLLRITKDIHIIKDWSKWVDADNTFGLLAQYQLTSFDAIPPSEVTVADADFTSWDITISADPHVETSVYIRVTLENAKIKQNLRVVAEGEGITGGNGWIEVTGPSPETYKYYYVGTGGNNNGDRYHLQRFDDDVFHTEFQGDLAHKAAERILPKGGTDGQILTKKGTADGASEWQDASSPDAAEQGVQGAFYFRLYIASATKPADPTAGTFDVDNDSFTVTPSTFKIQAPTVDESKGERLWAIESPIDPANDAGKTIDLTAADRWGGIFPVTGKQGAEGTVQAGLKFVDVGTALAVTTTGVEGPDMADLSDVIRLKFEYDRSGVTDVHYNPIVEKSDFAGLVEASAYKLQGRGAAGAAFEIYETNDKFYIKHPTAYTNVTLQIQNSQGGNTGPKGDPATNTDATARAAAAAAQTTADAALPTAGGTMTGKITLDGAPTNNLHAATKKYVDDNAGSGSATDQTARDAAKAAKDVADAALPLAGGTMTGDLTLSGAPTNDLHAASKKYVDDNAGSGGGGVTLKDFEDLPDLSDYKLDEIIASGNNFYRKGITDESEANVYTATVGRDSITLGNERWRGVSNSQSPNGFATDGGFTGNPNNALSLVMASNDAHIRFAVKKSVYETAKGSAFVTTDKVAIKITFSDMDTDEAVCAYYNSYTRDVNYLEFQHRHATDNYNLYSEAEDNTIKIEFFTVGSDGNATTTPFLTHLVGTEHWLLWSDGGTDGATALNIARANQARIDALDAAVDGGTMPIHDVTYDNTTALTAPLAGDAGDFAVETTYNDVKSTDLVVIDWTKCEHLNHHSEHIVPGSGSDAGRMVINVSNFDATEWDGEILYALEHAIQDNGSPDELNSWIVASIVWDSPNLTFGLHLQQGGSRTNRNLTARPGFSVQMRVFRNATLAQATSDNIHAKVLSLTKQLGGLSLVTLTQAEYTALAVKDAKTLYFTLPNPSP